MSRQVWKGSTLLNPEPPVLVSCGSPEKPNLITVGWCGTICTQPPMLSISVRPERYSHKLIKESGEFVVNPVSYTHLDVYKRQTVQSRCVLLSGYAVHAHHSGVNFGAGAWGRLAAGDRSLWSETNRAYFLRQCVLTNTDLV